MLGLVAFARYHKAFEMVPSSQQTHISVDLNFAFPSPTYNTVSQWVPIIGTESLQGPFWRFGSLFIFQGPYFQCFDYIYAENINSVCMNTTMS